MNNLLGKLDETGTVIDWPKTDILGANYTPPATRVQVTATEFVVIPPNFTQWELIESLKPLPVVSVAKGKKGDEG